MDCACLLCSWGPLRSFSSLYMSRSSSLLATLLAELPLKSNVFFCLFVQPLPITTWIHSVDTSLSVHVFSYFLYLMPSCLDSFPCSASISLHPNSDMQGSCTLFQFFSQLDHICSSLCFTSYNLGLTPYLSILKELRCLNSGENSLQLKKHMSCCWIFMHLSLHRDKCP